MLPVALIILNLQLASCYSIEMIECHQVANFALSFVIILVQFADDYLEGDLNPMKKDRTENIQKIYKKCAPYGNCTEIVQKIYKKCAKFCNSSLVETVSLFELLQILAHFLYIFCTISVQFPYGAHFLYVFCMFSVRSFFIGHGITPSVGNANPLSYTS